MFPVLKKSAWRGPPKAFFYQRPLKSRSDDDQEKGLEFLGFSEFNWLSRCHNSRTPGFRTIRLACACAVVHCSCSLGSRGQRATVFYHDVVVHAHVYFKWPQLTCCPNVQCRLLYSKTSYAHSDVYSTTGSHLLQLMAIAESVANPRHECVPPSLVRSTPEHPIPSNSDEVLFASCLDNARRCFLVLKYVFMPLALLYGVVMVALNALWYFGYIENFSNVFFLHNCVIAVIIGAPVVLIPAIVRLRRIPASVRLTVAHTLFALVCLLVPICTAYCVWRRQYQEVNGFLLVHEFFPAAPPRVRAAVVSKHEPLSICDDEVFFVLFVFDHALMSVSPFFLWMMIELPPKFFAFSFSVHTLHFWASAFRISNVYIDTCSNHPMSVASVEIAKQCLPIGHMIHFMSFVGYMFTRLFVFSRNREQNKKWVRLVLEEAVSSTRIHLEAAFRVNNTPKPRRAGTFWSRTECMFLQQEEPPLVLPANVGIAFKVSAGLKDWGSYVIALGLPIYFSVFELMQLFISVDPLVSQTMYVYFSKCLLFVTGVITPHFIFSKAIHQGRVRSPWLVTTCCFVVIILCVHFIKPGTTRILPRNFRSFPFFIMSNVAPPTILRAISHVASAMFIVLAFVVLHMYQHPFPLHLQAFFMN